MKDEAEVGIKPFEGQVNAEFLDTWIKQIDLFPVYMMLVIHIKNLLHVSQLDMLLYSGIYLSSSQKRKKLNVSKWKEIKQLLDKNSLLFVARLIGQ